MRFLSAEKGYQCQGCGAEEMSGSDSYDYTGGVADAGLGEKNEGRRVIYGKSLSKQRFELYAKQRIKLAAI